MTTPPDRPARPGTRKLLFVTLAAVGLSVGGVAWAVFWNAPADGGRGGALAVALAFYMLFAGRGTAAAAPEADLPAPASPLEEVEQELAKVRASLGALIDWSGKEKVYLTISSVVGTLFWGFGDLLARVFIWLLAG